MTQDKGARKAPASFKRWHEAGYTSELLPIIPPDAALAAGSSVRPEYRGKTPGVRNGDGSWNGLGGSWSNELQATVEDAKRWQQWGASVGLQGRAFPGLDIDVEDEALADAISELASDCFGYSPVRFRSGSFRRLRMYRTAEPLKKRRLAFTIGGVKHAVELLGHGQQYLVEGPHPKGGAYAIDQFWTADTLTEIDAAHVESFFTALAELLTKRGAVLEHASSTSTSTTARTGLDNERLHAKSPGLVVDALKVWRNDLSAHDDFVQALAAIKAALGPDRERYYGDVEEWALAYPGNDEAYVRKTWDSITDAALGAEWLFGKAHAAGFAGDAQADFDEAPAAAIPETPIERMVKRFVWVSQIERYVDMASGAFLSGRAFNAENIRVAEFGKSGTNSAEAQFQNCPGARKAAIVTYRPGRPATLADVNSTTGKEVSAVNLWHPPTLKPVKGDAGPYLKHIELVFGPEGTPSREHFMDWCAFVLQNPGRKINHAIVLTGAQGVGKDTSIEPLIEAVGRHNVQSIKPEQLSNQFTHFLQAQVVIVEEMSNFTKREVYNRLKDWIAAPPYTVEINKKNQHPYTIPNIQNWIFYSNYEDAIALDEDDRRYWVHRSLLEERLEPAYYRELWDWMKNRNGFAIVAGYLKARDVAQFDPAAPPPMTEAKREMVDAAAPPVVRWLAGQFGAGGLFEGRELVTAREIAALRNDPMSPLPGKMAESFKDKHATQALRMAEFQPIGTKVKIGSFPPVRLWTSKPPALVDQLGHGKIAERYLSELKGNEAKRKGA